MRSFPAHPVQPASFIMKRFLLVASCAASWCALAQSPSSGESPQVGAAQPVIPLTLSFSEQPQDVELQTSQVFPEMLVPMAGEEQPEENADLAAALLQFAERTDHEDISMFQAFLERHPASRWNAAIFLNLAAERYERGYLSQALQHWENAWNLARSETEPQIKLVAERALAELLLLNARLGRTDRLDVYFEELSRRTYDSSIGSLVDSARQGLARMRTQPEIAFKCGPYALNSILNARDKTPFASNPVLEAVPSTTRGTNLVQVREWAAQVGLNYQVARRESTGQLIFPAVIHWKLDHFAALLGELDGRYLVQDATFGGGEMWITEKALEAETDGYFLIPAGELPAGWTAVSDEEAAQVWGKGGAQGRDENSKTCSSPKGGTEKCSAGMASSSYYLMQASLNLRDVPLYYQPPVGPLIAFAVNYNHLETEQSSLPAFSNLGPSWDFNWVGYLDVDPNLTVTVRLRDGGTEVFAFSQFNNITGAYLPDRYSQAVLRWTTGQSGNDVYRRELSDGSVEVYSQPMTTVTGQDKRYFLKQVIDPQGNVVTLNYEFVAGAANPVYNGLTPGQNTGSATATTATGRVNEIVDAAGGVTLIRYLSNTRSYSSAFYRIKQVYSPPHRLTGARRFVEFSYNGTATVPTTLSRITDAVGMVSSFSYDSAASASGFINTLTTEYGRTLFHQYSDSGILTRADGPDEGSDPDPVLDPNGNPIPVPGLMRGLRVTYPNGSVAVVENWLGHHMKTFHWDRNAMKRYPMDVLMDVGNPERSAHCELYVWLMDVSRRELSAVPLSFKQPLKEPVNYAYQGQSEVKDPSGQTSHQNVGGTNLASSVDQTENVDGSSQKIVQSSDYNLQGNLSKSVDPVGRVTHLAYDGSGVDLLEVRQQNGSGTDLLARMLYNTRHLPVKIWDGGGHLTEMTYNAYGQVTSVKNALNEVVTLSYIKPVGQTNPNAHDSLLASIDGPQPGGADVTTFTYDGHQRLESAKDADGYQVWYEYDDLNRPTKITYQPQGVVLAEAEYEEVVWDRLDPVLLRDRQGRLTRREYDSMGMLVAETDSEGRRVEYEWCTCGSLASLKDANGHVTEWFYDDLGRMIRKTRADGRVETLEYYPNSDRVRYVTQAGLARREMLYEADGAVKEVRYQTLQGQPPAFVTDPRTPGVTYQYDPSYPRLLSATSALGAIRHDYHPYRSSPFAALKPGAGQLRRVVDESLSAETLYQYDALGRAIGRSIDSVINDLPDSGAQTFSSTLDASGRLRSLTDFLGTFTYDYVDPLKGLGSLEKITSPNGTSTSFGWHGLSHQGRLKEIIQRFTLPQGGSGAARNAYGYAPGGQLRSWTREEGAGDPAVYGPGEQWSVEHDQADQLRSVVVRGTGPGRELRRQFYYSYDAAGNRVSSQMDHGVMPFEYNAVNQKVGTFGNNGTGLVRFEGTLEEPGVVDIRGVKARTRTVTDEAGSPEFRFSADVPLELEDNRVRVSALGDNGRTAQQDYDVYILGQAGVGLPSYDSRGNMISNGLNQGYEWDAASRLAAITYADGTRTEFGYDALGRRARVVERTGAGVQEKRLLWCGLEICQERDAGNAVVRRYGPHGFMDQGGGKWYYGRDHLGSVTQLLDEGGRVVDRYSYDPYGVQPPEAEEAFPEIGLPVQFRLRADQNVIKDAQNQVIEWRHKPRAGEMDAKAPSVSARPTWVGDAIRFDGTDDVLEGRLGSDSVSRDLTIFVVHRRLEEKSGVGPLSFSLPMIAGEAESVDGALALVWGNTWSEPTRTLAGGIGMVTTGPGGTQWRGPAVAAGAGASVPASARGGFEITTLVKSGTEHVGPGEWTYSSDLKVRHRNELGVGESTRTLTMTASWRAAGYALGRLLVASGQGAGYLKGDIAEIVVCLGVVEEGRRQAVEDYLARRYFAKERSDMRYTGHYYHGKSGLHLAPYRAYDAKHGVWLSEDPIQEEGGINLYGYVGNSPLMKFDPLGLLDLNLFGPNDPIKASAQGVPTVAAESRLAGHGCKDGAIKSSANPNNYDPAKDIYTPEELGAMIKALPQTQEGKPCKLMMCELDQNPDYVQKVANSAGVPVSCAKGKVMWPVIKANWAQKLLGKPERYGDPSLIDPKNLPGVYMPPVYPK